MPHPTIFRTPWVEITPHYEEIALRYGGAALERLRAFGLAERREAAIATILAGGVPLIGLLLLDWSPATAVLALLLNLWLTMFEDLAKIVRARGRLAAQQQLCNQDEFVWPIVRALARRRRTLDGRDLPVPELLDVPHRPDVPFVFAILATIAVAIPGWILWRDPGVHAEPAQLVLGTAPNLVLFAFAAALQATAWNRRWRDAASVRLAIASERARLAMYTGLATVGFFVRVVRDPVDPRTIAFAGCAAIAAVGAWRALQALRMRAPAHWLERELAHRDRYAGRAAPN